MKEATIVLTLYQGHQITRSNVTPIEAMLLVAEHNKSAGGEAIKLSDVTDEKEIKEPRTVDQEMDRLRLRYHASKIHKLLTEVRDMPTDYKTAIERGGKISMPTSRLSETKL